MPRPTKPAHRTRFRALMSRGSNVFNLAEAALLIAAEANPALDIARYLARLDTLADEIRPSVAREPTMREALSRLSRYLADDVGLIGNQVDYYDPANSFINEVLDRRMGIPIALSVVYLEIAWRLGLALRPIGLPGHFVVGLFAGDEVIVVDPFNRGRLLSLADCAGVIREIYGGLLEFRPEMLAPVTGRDVILRMLGNLRGIASRQEDFHQTLRWSELSVIASRQSAQSLRERGTARYLVGDLAGAAADFQRAFARSTSQLEREEAAELLSRVENLLARRN